MNVSWVIIIKNHKGVAKMIYIKSITNAMLLTGDNYTVVISYDVPVLIIKKKEGKKYICSDSATTSSHISKLTYLSAKQWINEGAIELSRDEINKLLHDIL